LDEQLILAAERLRDDLTQLRTDLRSRYKQKTSQVVARQIKEQATALAEIWLTELAPREEVTAAVDSDYVADLTVHFQRLLTCAEHATVRSRYDIEINAILKEYSVRVVVPMKALRDAPASTAAFTPRKKQPSTLTAFVGHSFAPADEEVSSFVIGVLEALGMTVQTGTRPRADRISDKVKGLIDQQEIFVGIFTRRDRLAGKQQWTTTEWVIDEKAYAYGKDKILILLKEDGVGSIGGIQGDYEYLPFSRDGLHSLGIRLLQLFEIERVSLR
jgi:hypothetical protein